jgi:hypothetical protein
MKSIRHLIVGLICTLIYLESRSTYAATHYIHPGESVQAVIDARATAPGDVIVLRDNGAARSSHMDHLEHNLDVV